MNIHLTIKKRVFNDPFYPYLKDGTPLQIFFGGSASGKSVFVAQRCVLDILRGRNYLVVRNVKATIKATVFAEIKKAIRKFKLNDVFKINETDFTITSRSNNRQILFRGLDDTEKLKSIVPLDGVLTDIWVEEATEATEGAINQLRLRMRGSTHFIKRMTLTFNPISQLHWLKRRYFAGFSGNLLHTRDRLILKTTHWDNRFLTKQDHNDIEAYKDIDEFYYKVYALGEWGVLGNVIFKNWSTEDLSGIRDNFDMFRNGLDFGYSNDPTALVRSSLKHEKIYIFEELYERGLTNDAIADAVKPIIGEDLVVCDSAEPKSIQELCQYNVNPIGARKGKDSVRHGIKWLQSKKIVVDKKCQNTINELTVSKWKQDKDGNSLNQPVDKNNHIIDALRYSYEEDMISMDQLTTSSDLEEENN